MGVYTHADQRQERHEYVGGKLRPQPTDNRALPQGAPASALVGVQG